MKEFLLKLLYMSLVVMLGNPAVLAIVGGIYVQESLVLLTIVAVGVYLYYKYIWLPFRVKFETLDDQCMSLMGWNKEIVNTTSKLDIISLMEKIETYEDCPCDVKLLVWTGDSFEVEYVDMECEYGTYYPANGVEFTHYMVLPNEEKMIDVLL